jgi:hypothetical protein
LSDRPATSTPPSQPFAASRGSQLRQTRRDPARSQAGDLVDEDTWRPAGSTQDAIRRAITTFSKLGAVVLDEALPAHLEQSLDITDRWHRTTLTGEEVDRQLRDWDRFSARLTRAASRFDVVIGPVVADVAPLDRPLEGEDYIYTLPWSLTGWPAVSLPAGTR